MDKILTSSSVSIRELKKNLSTTLDAAAGGPVAILNRRRPVAYLLSAPAWEAICDRLDDVELARIAQERLADGEKPVKVSLNAL